MNRNPAPISLVQHAPAGCSGLTWTTKAHRLLVDVVMEESVTQAWCP